MPSDDRERKFENALASHVRANSSAGVSHNPCADAEMLAAYHQDLLPPEQIASLKTHVTDCSRCQEILGLLEATDELVVAPVEILRAAAAATPAVRILPSRKPTLWRWVAPAGALAATLLVWISVRENNSLRIPPQVPTASLKAETAKDLPSPKPQALPQSSSAAQAAPAAPTDTLNALTAAPDSKIDASRRFRTQAFLKQKESASEEKKSRADDFTQFLEKSPDSDASLALDSNARSDARAKAATDKRDALVVSPSPQLSGGAVAGAIASAPAPQPPAPEPGQLSKANASLSAAEAPAVQRQELQNLPAAKRNPEMRLANAISEVIISAPGDRVSWRIGPAGLIDFSADAGKTWILQPSGVIADLLAGSAPSEKVCWIVGRAGTILRTTDGGAHWQKVRSPTQDDIRSVAAQDARHATILLADASYQTTDAGATWNKLAPE
jgi:hypothetical protein